MKMALIIRPFSSNHLPKLFFWKYYQLNHIIQRSCNVDKIDCFTTNLVIEKATKWKNIETNLVKLENQKLQHRNISFNILIKGLINDINNIDSLMSIELDISKLSKEQLNSLICATIETENETDFFYIINQCIAKQILFNLNDNILTFLSFRGKIEIISELEELYHSNNDYSMFLPYKGYAYWRKGNISAAIKEFRNIYTDSEDKTYKNSIYRIFKIITNETFNTKGEAITYKLLNFSKDLHVNFNDIFLLCCIWYKAFTSHWFSDQNLSKIIFEENESLRDIIEKGSFKCCCNILEENNTDAVYRLIELFLKYHQKEAYENCLKLLFDYYYVQKDIRACTEIITFLKTLDIPITSIYNEKLINLLIKQTHIDVKPVVTKKNKFQYKF